MAEYKGKEVKLDDPFRLPQGSGKKFGVYVKNPKSGNVIMVKFGDPNLSIKRDDPDRLKNFRARHNCDQKTDKTTPGYWSCKFWEKDSPVSKLLKQGKVSESDLKFKGKEMKDHLDKAKAKLKAEYGSLDNVDYKKAMKVVGATLAARLSARGMIKRSDGSTKKGKLGKPEEEMLTCGCEEVNEEKQNFIKGWVNPRTKKIIAWNTMQPYHAKHIYDNLSKYGLTTNDLIDHYIAVLSKRSPKYKPDREELEKRFEQIGKNNMLADRDETLEYPAIKKGWVAFVLEDFPTGKAMTLRGIKKDIKKSSIMILDKFKTFKDLDRILITNYKDTKFAEYTGKTKNEDERYSSNSEAMQFLFGRRPKRREPKTEIGRTMAMFREERARDYKGWVNPKTGQTRVIQGYTPYHVQMIVKDPRFFGLTEKEIKEALVKKYEPDIDAEFMADEQIGAIKRGTQDVDNTIELLAMEKGMVRFVEGEYGEISGRKKFNDRELRKILQLIDKETPLTMKPKTTVSLQQYRPGRYGDVIVDLYGNIEMNEIKNLIKGRKRGDKQTEIGRTMAMFREFCEAVKTRVGSDQEVLVVQDADKNVKVFDDMESAQKKAEEISGKVITNDKGEIMVQVLIDPSLRKHLGEEDQWKDKNDEREHNKLFIKSMKTMPGSPKQKKIIQQMNALRKKNGLELLDEAKRVPKTRKNQDPDTHSDLYTDEDPRGTIHGLGFKDVETAEASVRKIKASDRTHAHKIQAAIAMEQRAKVMKKTAEAAVYRKYIEQMKKKTKEMQEERKAPRDKGSGLPKKYVSGLSDKEAKQKAKEIEKRMKLPKDHPDAYKPVDDVEDPSIIDKKKSQQKSKATAKFQKAFGESFKEYIEEKKIKGIENKAKKTGVSYGILKQVYDRGMAAWRTGHRPGIPQQQWAYARINSFLTGGKTQKTTDKDLWAKVPAGVKSGIKAKLKEEAYLPGQATTSRGGKSGRGGSRGPRMSRQRKNRAEVLDQLALNGIQVLNQPQVVTGKGGSDTFVVAKKDVKKAKKVLDDYFEKAYVKIHMGKKGLRRDNYTIVAESVNLDEQKIRTQVEFDSLTDAVKSVKFHPTRDKGREVAIYKLTPPKRTMRTSAERPSGKKVGSVDFQKKTVYTTVTLPNGPFEKILKAKGAKRIATVKNVDGKAKVLKEQVKSMDQKKAKKIYDKLKKGSEIEVNFGNFMHSGGKPIVLKVTSGHRIVGKSKVGRIILVNPENPRGMKYKLFNRDGNISLAQGDMATILKDMNIIKEQRVIQESGHEDVPSAKNKVMMNLVSLRKIHKILCCMDPHASLPSWLTDKLTIATSKLDTVGDYLESQVMQSESTDPNFWLIELNEDEDDKKKKGKNPRDTKYYTKSGRIKKSPEDKETGLPKKYVSRMTKADAKQKADEIKARKKYGKDDPRRYKPTEVDKKYAGTGEKSKYTKAYDKMFGKDDD